MFAASNTEDGQWSSVIGGLPWSDQPQPAQGGFGNKAVLILVNVRLGTNTVNPIYYDSLKVGYLRANDHHVRRSYSTRFILDRPFLQHPKQSALQVDGRAHPITLLASKVTLYSTWILISLALQSLCAGLRPGERCKTKTCPGRSPSSTLRSVRTSRRTCVRVKITRRGWPLPTPLRSFPPSTAIGSGRCRCQALILVCFWDS